MTDVASLELCKELYEVSGWFSAELRDSYYTPVGKRKGHLVKDVSASDKMPLQLPAYTLGYLLRKLPKGCSVFRTVSSDEVWIATAGMKRLDDFYSGSDTPENAACKLTIELFKQGVLK